MENIITMINYNDKYNDKSFCYVSGLWRTEEARGNAWNTNEWRSRFPLSWKLDDLRRCACRKTCRWWWFNVAISRTLVNSFPPLARKITIIGGRIRLMLPANVTYAVYQRHIAFNGLRDSEPCRPNRPLRPWPVEERRDARNKCTFNPINPLENFISVMKLSYFLSLSSRERVDSRVQSALLSARELFLKRDR